MPRTAREVVDDTTYHVINRGNDRCVLFADGDEFRRFEALMSRARSSIGARVFAYCLMTNHWHLVVRPSRAPELARFVGRISQLHAQWRRVRDETVGEGHLYQGRFHAYPVLSDEHFLTVCRYVERNPVEAGMVARAEQWPWSSAAKRFRGEADPMIDAWPMPTPSDWLSFVNECSPAGSVHELHGLSTRVGPPRNRRVVDGAT